MPDPASNVPAQLLPHVHLLSTIHLSAVHSQLQPDQVLQYLLKAPHVMREEKPVAWQYLRTPADGSLFLAWQPLNHRGTAFASDGYIWSEPTRTLTHNTRGYEIELLIQESGFIPHHEQLTVHRRIRHRLIGGPGPVDPAIELVQYIPALNHHRVPSSAIQITPQRQSEISQRQYLEQSGGLTRKEFMLEDQNNWPTISKPPRPAQAIPPNPYQQRPPYGGPGYPGMNRPGMPQQMFEQGGQMRSGPGIAQPPPGRRPRQSMGARMAGGPGGMLGPAQSSEEAVLADEDNPTHGDALDLLSPRDISHARYKQHHEWMDEILLSPYAANQIIPVGLGFNLSGDLGELTAGIFTKDDEMTKTHEITAEQVQELEKRVSEHMKTGQDSIESMKKSHQEALRQLDSNKVYDDLERRLAHAGADGGSEADLHQILSEFEKTANGRLVERKEVVEVQKGGLQGNEEINSGKNIHQQTRDNGADGNNDDYNADGDANGAMDEFVNHQDDDFSEFADLDQGLDNTAGEGMDISEFSGPYDHMIPL